MHLSLSSNRRNSPSPLLQHDHDVDKGAEQGVFAATASIAGALHSAHVNATSTVTAESTYHVDPSASSHVPSSPTSSSASLSGAQYSATAATSYSYDHTTHHPYNSNNNGSGGYNINYTNSYLGSANVQPQAQPSSLPLISSPLAMNFGNGPSTPQGNSNNNRASYSFRSRTRKSSFQQGSSSISASMAFSPPSTYNSPSITGNLAFGASSNGGFGGQQRWSHLMNTPEAPTSGSSRSRCLSTCSVDSNASSSTVGVSRLTPAMMQLSVQQHHSQHATQQPLSAATSPYQSYSSSPQSGGLHYPQQHQMQTSSSYQYNQSQFSSPLPQAQIPAYDSLSPIGTAAAAAAAAANATASPVYGSTPPSHFDLLYSSSNSQYSHVTSTPSYNYSPRSVKQESSVTSPFALAPSSYYDQDPARLLQQLELSYPATAMGAPVGGSSNGAGAGSTRPFEYGDQHQSYHGSTSVHHPQTSSYPAQPGQQQSYEQSSSSTLGASEGMGLGIVGGMARGISDSTALSGGRTQFSSNSGATTAAGALIGGGGHDDEAAGTTSADSVIAGANSGDEARTILSDNGRKVLFPCGQCEKVFTTKSNLKRHLENINIHNTPYERRRDQKRWQGHEKKQASREETTLRMRRWRDANREKNRFNDMRCRVYRIAKDKFGVEDSDEKEAWIQTEIEKRKSMLLLRHSRKAEWNSLNAAAAAVATGGNTGVAGYGSSYITFGAGPNGGASSLVGGPHQIPAYGPNGQPLPMYDGANGSVPPGMIVHTEDTLKEGDRKFIELLRTQSGPRRRRSRQAMTSGLSKGQSQGPTSTNPTSAGDGSTATSNPTASNSVLETTGSAIASVDTFTDARDSALTREHQQSSQTESNTGPHSMDLTNPLLELATSAEESGSLVQPPKKKRRSRRLSTSSGKDAVDDHESDASDSGHLYGSNGGYINAEQRLQDIYQGVYQTRGQQHQTSTQQEGMDTIVSDLGINDAKDAAVNGSSTTAPTTAGGLYGDRELSGWIDWHPSSAQNSDGHGSHPPAQPHGTDSFGSRQYPFPEMTNDPSHGNGAGVKDRKGLAKAAGIRIDIPQHQHPLGMNPDGTLIGMGVGSEDMVGGSATSVTSSNDESQVKSPVSANSSLQSPLPSNFHNGSGNNNPSTTTANNGNSNSYSGYNSYNGYNSYSSYNASYNNYNSYHPDHSGSSLVAATSGGKALMIGGRKMVHKAASHEMFTGLPSSFTLAMQQQQQQQQQSNQGTTSAGFPSYPLQPIYGSNLGLSQTNSQGLGSFSLAQQAQVRSFHQSAMTRSQGVGHQGNPLSGYSSHGSNAHGSNGTAGSGAGGEGGNLGNGNGNNGNNNPEIDYFTTLVLPAAGDISVSSTGASVASGLQGEGNGGSGAGSNGGHGGNGIGGSPPGAADYLVKQQLGAPRRHSTQLTNLSTNLPPMNMAAVSPTNQADVPFIC